MSYKDARVLKFDFTERMDGSVNNLVWQIAASMGIDDTLIIEVDPGEHTFVFLGDHETEAELRRVYNECMRELEGIYLSTFLSKILNKKLYKEAC